MVPRANSHECTISTTGVENEAEEYKLKVFYEENEEDKDYKTEIFQKSVCLFQWVKI